MEVLVHLFLRAGGSRGGVRQGGGGGDAAARVAHAPPRFCSYN
jgi:hypothetical protein